MYDMTLPHSRMWRLAWQGQGDRQAARGTHARMRHGGVTACILFHGGGRACRQGTAPPALLTDVGRNARHYLPTLAVRRHGGGTPHPHAKPSQASRLCRQQAVAHLCDLVGLVRHVAERAADALLRRCVERAVAVHVQPGVVGVIRQVVLCHHLRSVAGPGPAQDDRSTGCTQVKGGVGVWVHVGGGEGLHRMDT